MIKLSTFDFKKEEEEWYFEEVFEEIRGFKDSNYLEVTLKKRGGPLNKNFDFPQNFQQNALSYFIDNHKIVLDNLCDGILNFFYSEKGKIYTEHFRFDKEKENITVFNSIKDVKNYISIGALYIHGDEKNGYSYLGFICDCPWDGEHGLGVIMHKETVMNIGDSDIAMHNWLDK